MDVGFDAYDDDMDVLELINARIPRQVHQRTDYFHIFDELSFFKRFRLSKNTVRHLLPSIEHLLEFPDDRNNSVSPINQLLMTLRYYATGSHLQTVADFGGVHISTVCRIVKRVSEALASLCDQHINFPQLPEEIVENQRKFFDIAGFPRVIGVIDGTHIKVQSPGGDDGEVFRNRKRYFSCNVQVACSAEMKIMDIVARWPGSAHDSTIFNNSVLKMRFEQGEYQNCVLLGDSAYNLRSYFLTPLLNPITPAEQRYNEAHISTRNIIERVFGVWKRRFPVLAYGCRLKIVNTLTVIVATAVLHNIARDMAEEEPPLQEEHNILDQLIDLGNIPNVPLAGRLENFNNTRQIFINQYFNRM